MLFCLGAGRSEGGTWKTDREFALFWGAIAAAAAFLLTFLFTGISKWLLKTGINLETAIQRVGYFLLLLPVMITVAVLVGIVFVLLSELIGVIKKMIGVQDRGWEGLSGFILVAGLGIIVGIVPVTETYFMLLYSWILGVTVV